MTREEKIALARALYKRGLNYCQIGEQIGVASSSIYRWLNPDHAAAQREASNARKKTYRGVCVDCGGPTTGCNGPNDQPRRCSLCRHQFEHELRIWVPETIIEAIQAWREQYGFIPAAADWSPALARQRNPDSALREQRYRDGAWPPTSTVLRECGSWNAAIRAAGFEPLRAGYYGRPGEDLNSFPVRRAIALYTSGLSSRDVGALIGVTGQTILRWLHATGTPVRSLSDAQTLRRKAAA